jgi:hypothetical protein
MVCFSLFPQKQIFEYAFYLVLLFFFKQSEALINANEYVCNSVKPRKVLLVI